jgi:hypothetical protein
MEELDHTDKFFFIINLETLYPFMKESSGGCEFKDDRFDTL